MAAKTRNVATDVDVQMQVSHTPRGAGKVSDFQEEAQQVLAREGQAVLVSLLASCQSCDHCQ